jgi:hypothetical protein
MTKRDDVARASQQEVSGPSSLALWFGMFGSAVAWAGHLIVSYPMQPLYCAMGSLALLWILTILLFLVAVASAFVAWRNWNAIPEVEHGRLLNGGESRRAFMALFGMLGGALFVFAMLLAFWPIAVGNPCL